jgi:hypothetical protein
MTYAYFYAPITAYSREWSGHSACNGGSGLIDISEWTYGSADDEVRAYFSYPAVRSIHYTRLDNCCSACGAAIQSSVKVDVYALPNLGCWMGWVLYGHLDTPTNSGWINLSSSQTSVYIGMVPWPPANCNCYDAAHSHMEKSNAVKLVSPDQWVTAGTTPIYRWTVPDLGSCPI